jgi:multiple antibiotic resistance protein
VSDFANAFLLVYAGLFPIVNPVGAAPIFHGLTAAWPAAGRRLLARRVAINSALLLAGSMFVGSHLLVLFGITLPVVRIAGGLVVVVFGWKLLHSGVRVDGDPEDSAGHGAGEAESFYPLTLPLTIGPGSISVAIALGSQRPSTPGLSELILLGGAALAGILAIALTVYVCYRFAEPLIARLGKGGTNVVVRLSAFLLLCIGIQILWAGYSSLALAPR